VTGASAAGRPPARIVVFRALMLGDMLCAVPALRALRQGWPQAHIALVGLPWAADLAARLSCVDEFIELPSVPGLPESARGSPTLPAFLEQMRARRFDLAIQMHGSGGVSNPLVRAFGARRTIGFSETGAPPDWLPWPRHGPETERLLQLTDALGLPRRGEQLEFPLVDQDRAEAARLLQPLREGRPYVCVHGGAQLASRRWPAQRFAAVADALAASGRTVVLTGAASETALVASITGAMHHEAIDLVGRTSLWTLGAVIEGAERVVCNDTGVSHIAAALARPSIVVSSGGEVARWAPADRGLHRVLWEPMACRPCSHAVCPSGHACALAVTVPQVLRELKLQAFERAPGRPTKLPSDHPFQKVSGILDHV
jgi:ADP-heptose:LPS heptosyltransferase